jgi:LacI family transcriptional regulator
MPRPTMVDVAREAGVSASTVERVLSGRHRVRPETAGKVLEAAEAVGFYGVAAIRRRLQADLPSRRLGFLLQQATMPFHRMLGDALATATEGCPSVRGQARLDFSDDLDPQAVATRLERLGEACDAVAVVSADHPLLARAVDRLHARDVPVFAAVSEISADSRAGYVGVDNRKLGRTAAWFVTRMARPGKAAIVLGTHRHLCQEQREIGFRSYLREHGPAFEVLEPVLTHEVGHFAEEVTLALLKRHPDLGGLFVAGGGVRGVLAALTKIGPPEGLCTVCVERNDETQAGLLSGLVSVILAHPIERLAAALVAEMVAATTEKNGGKRGVVVLPFEILTSENL